MKGPAPVVPRATYRVQLHPGFGFDELAAAAPYLAELGVSHVHCSPYLQAAAGSTHGYDVVDHHQLNRELGGEEAYGRMCKVLAGLGLSQVLDIVPNHMAALAEQNPWWWDVLENGPSSRYAATFDIDWGADGESTPRVLLPILGDHYGRVLEAGQLVLERREGAFAVRYFEHAVPVSPRTLEPLLSRAAARCGSDQLATIAAALGRLPLAGATDRASTRLFHRDKEVLGGLLARLAGEEPEVAAAIDEVAATVNADTDALDGLLQRQNYRLALWRVASEELDYRRFFDVPTLVGLRQEHDEVFHSTHQLVLRLVDDGLVTGLRVDHPDGLRDPEGYLRRLYQSSDGAWVAVEKILGPGEELPAGWLAGGTTGYDFLNVVGGLFVDPAGEKPLSELHARFTGNAADYPDLVREKKHLIMATSLAADLNRVVHLAEGVCRRHRRYVDYTRKELGQALAEMVACFPVYRTYLQPGRPAGDAEVAQVAYAVEEARTRRPDIGAELFEFLADVVLLRVPGDEETELALRFQQLTSPVTAKGVEDTAFYCYRRLLSLNEVGGDPGRFGTSVEELHAHNRRISEDWPATMVTISTHDTKRSADVRARISLLSEMPEQWALAVRRWSAHNERHKHDGLPDRGMEYLFYQTIVGAWPLPAERAVPYMEKASKEAKELTSWVDPDPRYDAALRSFVEAALDDPELAADVASFVGPLVEPGRVASLAQVLLFLTAPGVPDLYQGTEVWDLSLVDPDNRRLPDYRALADLGELVAGASAGDVMAIADSGAPKLWLVRRALVVRRSHAAAFAPGSAYDPLAAAGAKAAHAVAYARGGQVAVVAPRLVLGLAGQWEDTTVQLPPGRWTDVLGGSEVAGGPVALADLLHSFPVALLVRD